MKYVILIPDGAADFPLPELNNKTVFEYADVEPLHFLARQGLMGTVLNTPKQLPPGSDVAIMSILGYDPAKYYSGRGPLEAAAMGVELREGDFAYRLNLVTVEDGIMKDYSAGHISSEHAAELIEHLRPVAEQFGLRLFPGVSYRHLLVLSQGELARTTPPHDIQGKEVADYLPQGGHSSILIEFMRKASQYLLKHPLLKNNKVKANAVWPWGGGVAVKFPSYKKVFGKNLCAISAVGLVKGLVRLLGGSVIEVPGATGFIDTNYKGKLEAAIKALKECDVVLLHYEATDEMGHLGDAAGKVKALELFVQRIVKPLVDFILGFGEEIKLLLLPDHPTPVKVKTHVHEPVPFVVWHKNINYNMSEMFTEKKAQDTGICINKGFNLVRFLYF